MITSLDGQAWVFDSATGRVCLGSCPGAGNLGDFNGDGSVTTADLDVMVLGNAAFDVTGDGAADAADVNEMVANLIGTWIGDSNGDGEFGTGDFVQVFTIGKFESGQAAKWSEGDWNLDGQFNTSDFVAAFTEGGFEKGPRGGVAAVPEPSGMVMIFVSLLGLLKLRRK
ncbi:MAG: PEP-CTERM sorting domain-containing protein [Pirellulaceae bacterium]